MQKQAAAQAQQHTEQQQSLEVNNRLQNELLAVQQQLSVAKSNDSASVNKVNKLERQLKRAANVIANLHTVKVTLYVCVLLLFRRSANWRLNVVQLQRS